jgi:hypothetical protein
MLGNVNAADHRPPAAAYLHQHVFVKVVSARVFRMHLYPRFGRVAGKARGFAGACHGMPLVSHATGVQDERKILRRGVGR